MIPYGKQSINEDDIAAVVRVLRSEYLTTGPVIEQFEEAFATAVGAKHAVSCSNGTAALHLAAMAADLGPGKCAIVPAMTFVATANAVRFTGAEVVFCDVDPDNGLMTPSLLEQALERVPKDLEAAAVFPVDLNGNCADPVGIRAVADEHNLLVLEDACHALGTRYSAGMESLAIGSCSHADMCIFSFHPVKTITQGEGGVVTTSDTHFAQSTKALRSHGITREPTALVEAAHAQDELGNQARWYYEMQALGFNYRQTEIGSALGLSQLGRLVQFVQRRRELAQRYARLLRPLAPKVRFVSTPANCEPCLHLFVALIDFEAMGTSRAHVMSRLDERGIHTQVHYIPVNRQPYYVNRYGPCTLPGADEYYGHCLSLPLFPGLSDDEQDRVVSELADVLGC